MELLVHEMLATQIRALRERRGWSRLELSRRVGVSPPTITRYERLNYRGHSISILKKIASVFDVALVVQFISWGEFMKVVISDTGAVLSFNDDPMFKEG